MVVRLWCDVKAGGAFDRGSGLWRLWLEDEACRGS